MIDRQESLQDPLTSGELPHLIITRRRGDPLVELEQSLPTTDQAVAQMDRLTVVLDQRRLELRRRRHSGSLGSTHSARSTPRSSGSGPWDADYAGKPLADL